MSGLGGDMISRLGELIMMRELGGKVTRTRDSRMRALSGKGMRAISRGDDVLLRRWGDKGACGAVGGPPAPGGVLPLTECGCGCGGPCADGAGYPGELTQAVASGGWLWACERDQEIRRRKGKGRGRRQSRRGGEWHCLGIRSTDDEYHVRMT